MYINGDRHDDRDHHRENGARVRPKNNLALIIRTQKDIREELFFSFCKVLNY